MIYMILSSYNRDVRIGRMTGNVHSYLPLVERFRKATDIHRAISFGLQNLMPLTKNIFIPVSNSSDMV